MKRLGISDPHLFEYIEAPDKKRINDGIKLLIELDALDQNHALSEVGKRISDLPLDPRLSRVLLEANSGPYLLDAIIVVASLSIRDIVVQHEHRARHAYEKASASDFYAVLCLWQTINEHRKNLSNSRFKEACLSNSWSIQRIFEWRDLVRQISSLCKEQDWNLQPWQGLVLDPEREEFKPQFTANSARYTQLHQSLLRGFLSHILKRNESGSYQGTRTNKVLVSRESLLNKTKSPWLIAFELTETKQVYARKTAKVNVDWIIVAARNHLKYDYAEPRFDPKSGGVRALRKTSYQSLELKRGELVPYQSVNPSESRTVFIQAALVDQQYEPSTPNIDFADHNQQLLRQVDKLEVKTRRRNLLVSDETIYSFFNDRLPPSICDVRSLEKWLKDGHQSLLKFDPKDLLSIQPNDDLGTQFPDQLELAGTAFSLQYKFEPHDDSDGITLTLPITNLAYFPDYVGEWLVPGLIEEKCAALIKSLPKHLRQQFTPAKQFVSRIKDQLESNDQPLTHVLGQILHKTRGVSVPRESWQTDQLDSYLLIKYKLVDENAQQIEVSTNLRKLKQKYRQQFSKELSKTKQTNRLEFEQQNLNEWPEGLHDRVTYQSADMQVSAHRMLRLENDFSVSVTLCEDEKLAAFNNQHAIPRLIMIAIEHGAKGKISNLRKELKSRLQPSNKSRSKGGLAAQLESIQLAPTNTKIETSFLGAGSARCDAPPLGRDWRLP
ncbi:MAG: DUF3418 domain-containing protein, partial [Pseudomonadota bacterium]